MPDHLSVPPPEKVRDAIRKSKEGGADGKVMKVLYLDDTGESVGEYPSTQLVEDVWTGITNKQLVEPPFSLGQMVFLAEMHPVHSSALDQKTADIVGKGWQWDAADPDSADETQRDELEDWFQGLAPDEFDMREVLASVWLDVETTGWGLLEVARDIEGKAMRLHHVPAHTVKAHKNGYALCQIRDSRAVWFRRWGAPDILKQKVNVNIRNGSIKNVPKGQEANDLFVIKRPSRRSSWYGIPGYVSSIGWITLALAARDDNLYFFANRREPRWAIVLTGMSDDTEIEDDLRRAFAVDLKQPYRNIIVPVSGKDAKVEFEKLSDTVKDGSFANLSDRADKAIMIAHRVPAERLANSSAGPLGGNLAFEANRVYKEGVVEPGQELCNSRFRRFISVEHGLSTGEKITPGHKAPWLWTLVSLDTRSEREDLDQSVIAFHGDMTTLREARHKIGFGPLMQVKAVPHFDETGTPIIDPNTGAQVVAPPVPTEHPGSDGNAQTTVYDEDGNVVEPELEESPLNDKLFTELPGAAQTAGSPAAMVPGAGKLTPSDKSRDGLADEVREMLRSSREIHARLVEKANDDE